MKPCPDQIESILAEAVEIASDAKRREFVDQACAGDTDLKRNVEKLIENHFRAGSFLESPAAGLPSPLGGEGQGVRGAATVDEPAVTERPGTLIGPYKLLQEIGEGGFGTVFMAEQEHPVRRKVALKVIKAGMDTRQVIARFEAERQALAMMDHVNIARVLDAGATESGRPYFVMELVHGVPITKYCDDNHLTPRERLELFVPVCQAIQHAHQKGIIHRDIKPSNVMITLYDGKPVPKVIDFGVAKATEQKLTEHTLFTQYGTMVGTFEYMSPEQAEMSALGVDTRSDIFSLGVLLYELLTGSTPLSHKRLKEAAFGEILRMIKEEEPPKPSTRLSDSGEALASISAQRHMEPAKLTKLKRGELDWIVMKTLEKDRNRRYETANGFAADLQRYLNDEPVQACPPSTAYRFRKFARRNRAVILTGAVVVAALVLGTVVSTWQAVRATRANDLAETRLQAEKLAHGEADTQRQQAEDAKKQAIANLQKAREAVDQMLTRVGEERLENVPQMEPVRKALLEDALKFYQGFLQQKSDDPALRIETGKAWRRVGYIRLYLYQQVAAEKAFQESIAIFEKLAEEFPTDPNYRAALADSYFGLGTLLTFHFHLGRQQEAEKAIRQSFALHQRMSADDAPVSGFEAIMVWNQRLLGVSLSQAGKAREAEEAHRHALALADKLVAAFPTMPSYRWQQADIYCWLGSVLEGVNRPQEAEQAYRQGLAIQEKVVAEAPSSEDYRHCLAELYYFLACLLRDSNRPVEAEEAYRKALAMFEKLAADFPNGPHHRLKQGRDLHGLGVLYAANNRAQEAEQAYRQALTILEKAVAEVPRFQYWYGILFDIQDRLARLLADAGRAQEAEQVWRHAADLSEKLAADAPTKLDHWQRLVRSQVELGRLLAKDGKAAEAETAYRRAVEIQEKLEKDLANKPEDRRDLAQSHLQAANLFRDVGRPQEAEKLYRLALEHSEKRAATQPDLLVSKRELAMRYLELGRFLREVRKNPEAEESDQQAMAVWQKIIASNPKTAEDRRELAFTHRDVALALTRDPKRIKDSEDHHRQSLVILEKLAAEFPGDSRYLEDVAHSQRYLGFLLSNTRRFGDAERAFTSAVKIFEKLMGQLPNVASHRQFLAGTLQSLGNVQVADGRPVDAEKSFRQAIAVDPKNAAAPNNLSWLLATGANPKFRDGKRAVELGKKAVELEPKQGMWWNTLGAAHYCGGNWKDSIAALEKSMELRQGGDSFDFFFLAMAHWQLGHKDEARKWYDQAVRWMEKYKPQDEELGRFRAEAAELLEVQEKKN